MTNAVTVEFAKGGFVLSTFTTDGEPTQEVFVSQGKLIKALRGAIDELSLLPKKAEAEDSDA